MRIGKILLILLSVLLVLWLVLQLGLVLLLKFGFRPVRITKLDETHVQRITACTGVSLPSNAKFVEGWHIPGRDPSDIYIFDLDASQKSEDETEDEYIRNTLHLNKCYYDANTGQIIHSAQLTELGYEFSWTIKHLDVDFSQCEYAYIHYCVIDENTIRIAFEFGFM